jgi:hypothetical protein
MHTIILTFEEGKGFAGPITHKGTLFSTKRTAEMLFEMTPAETVTIKTNRGTTWRLKDGRWIHDTGRKG